MICDESTADGAGDGRDARHRARHRAGARAGRVEPRALRATRRAGGRKRARRAAADQGRSQLLGDRHRQATRSRPAHRRRARTLRGGQPAGQQRGARAAGPGGSPRGVRRELRRADPHQPPGPVFSDPGHRARTAGAPPTGTGLPGVDRVRDVGLGGSRLDQSRRLLRQQGRPVDGRAALRGAPRRARHSRVRGEAGHHRNRHDGRRSGDRTIGGSPTASSPPAAGACRRMSAAPCGRSSPATSPMPPAA